MCKEKHQCGIQIARSDFSILRGALKSWSDITEGDGYTIYYFDSVYIVRNDQFLTDEMHVATRKLRSESQE